MNNKKLFTFYTLLWTIAFIFLFTLLLRMVGDAHIVNYAGIVRGGTQKAIVANLTSHDEEDWVTYIDEVLEDLQNGTGEYNSFSIEDEEILSRLQCVSLVWDNIKDAMDTENKELLYSLGVLHYEQADELVHYMENQSAYELDRYMQIFVFYFVSASILLTVGYYKNKKALQKITLTDHLTGMPSRLGFQIKAKSLLAQAKRNEFALVKLDIKEFKMINARYGHDLGNDLLCKIAIGMNELYGESSVCTRAGADDFMILLLNEGNVVETLKEKIYESMQDFEFKVGLSEIEFVIVGYLISNPQEPIDSIMAKADTIHRYVKENESYEKYWYSNELLEVMKKEGTYLQKLQESISKKEFKMHLQPQVKLTTMKLVGAEALVRWEMDDGRKVFPDEFIPLFEKKGVIPVLDYYMLEQACSYLQEVLPILPDFILAVNFSRITLSQKNFSQRIMEIIRQYDIPTKNIEIEVTETSLNKLEATFIEELQKLRDAGIEIAMDDFGAGYSSLGSLSRLPVGILKLDREFLWGMDQYEKMPIIIESTVQMAHRMGIKVVCEGVEKERDIHFISEIECDYCQGYYIDRPMTKASFTQKFINKKIEK